MYISNIHLKQGLSQVVVTDIVSDARGFIWLATFDGLNRFDGRNVKVFRHSPEDSTSIPSAKIHKMTSDDKEHLLMVTNNGFSIFNTRTNKVIPNNVFKNQKPLWGVKSNEEGKIWIYFKDKGFSLFNTSSGKVEEVKAQGFLKGKNDIADILIVKNILYVLTVQGDIIEFNVKSNQYSYYSTNIEGAVFSCINLDKQGNILIGSPSHDMMVFDTKTKAFTRSSICDLNNKLLSVNSIFYDSSKNVLWLSTYGQGVFIYNYANATIEQYKKGDKQLSIASNYALNLYGDSHGIVYIGYDGSGVDVVDPYVRKFVPITKEDEDETKTLKFVRKIVEDNQGNLLIGTAGSGLIEYAPSNGNIKFYTFDANNNFSEKYIIELAKVNNQLFLGFNGSGVGVLDINTLKPLYTIDVGTKENQISDGTIWSFLYDGSSTLWIGTRENGLNALDLNTKKVKQFTKEIYPFFEGNGVRCLFRDKNKNLLVGTEKGILFIENKTQKLIQVFPKNTSQNLGSLKSIKCLHQDKKGRIWAGTDGAGIAIFSPDFKLLRTFSTSDYLNNNVVYSLLPQNDSTIWISSNAGLTSIIFNEDVILNKQKPVVRNYDEINGLQSNEFNTGAYLQLSDGRFAFGGLNGINLFNPNDIKETPLSPKVYIQEFKVFENPIDLDQDVTFLEQVKLKHFENSISFSFSTLGSALPGKTTYQYRLLGYDKDWITTTDRTYVSYTNLPYGDYEFQVKATNYDGRWSQDPTILKVSIATPFYKTWWFISLVLLSVGSIIYAWYRNKMNQIKEKEAIRLQYTKELSEVEMKALRAQINPHFLFNSLNSINNFILRNDNKNASKYLVKFSQLVRNILNNSSSNFINLSEELSTIELYMIIEGMRFSNQFSYLIEIDPEVNANNVNIPSLLLQPYVENAIWHGLLHKDGDKNIIISVKRKGREFVSITIEDNGVGRKMAAEIEGPKQHKSFGMQIGENRIRLMNNGMDLSSSLQVVDLFDEHGNSKGTRIEIEIPYKLHQESTIINN